MGDFDEWKNVEMNGLDFWKKYEFLKVILSFWIPKVYKTPKVLNRGGGPHE